jgi:hypothetical protein
MPTPNYQQSSAKRLGRSYAWADVKILLFGRVLVGVTHIEYKKKRAVKANYGAGVEPVSYAPGNNEYEGKIILDKKEVDGIMAAAGFEGDILDIPPFDIAVTVGDDTTNKLTADILHDCQFLEMGRTMKQNDQEMQMEIPLFIMGITFNVQ